MFAGLLFHAKRRLGLCYLLLRYRRRYCYNLGCFLLGLIDTVTVFTDDLSLWGVLLLTRKILADITWLMLYAPSFVGLAVLALWPIVREVVGVIARLINPDNDEWVFLAPRLMTNEYLLLIVVPMPFALSGLSHSAKTGEGQGSCYYECFDWYFHLIPLYLINCYDFGPNTLLSAGVDLPLNIPAKENAPDTPNPIAAPSAASRFG